MDQTLKMKLDETEQSLIETYELALLYGDDVVKDSQEYQNIFEEILKVKNAATCCQDALEKAKQQSTVDDVEKEYSTEIKKNKAYQAKKTKEYKTFQTRLQQIKETFENCGRVEPSTSNVNRVECDELVMETQVQIIDPLTKRRMENPVKNKICGHNYEKSSILEAIRINRRLRCPVAGCGNNQFIQKEHLVSDDALKVHIMNIKDEESDGEDPLAI